MKSLSRRDMLRFSSLFALGTGVALQQKAKAQTVDVELASHLHVLNRLTYGARPEDIQKIQALGIAGYIEQQLHPETLPDPLVEEFLRDNPILLASQEEMQRAVDTNYDDLNRPALWGKIYRAVYSERQLFEKVVDFWTDHFNVPMPDLLVDKNIDDREVIRKHAFDKFRDLLFASAKSPAMLIYLDNASSNKEHPNENYARELLELHTIGVDGGYTEQDVKEVARAFTGWTLRDNWEGRFFFDRNMHDDGEKTILGHYLPAGRGIEDGLQVLDILATHPSTARFISYKLCRRFVSDTPPDNLVKSVTQVFLETDGDIRNMLRYIFTSKAFMNSAGQKFRRPFDMVSAILRTFRPSVTVHDSWAILYWLELMGNVPYNWFPPNGYPDATGAWLNANGLLHRWNAAMVFSYASQGWTDGQITLDLNDLIPPATTAIELINATSQRLLGYELSEEYKEQLVYFVSDYGDPNQEIDDSLRNDRLPTLVALVLSSPHFQWV
jgi:uncharacterized protein (DUF1800 family)